MERADPPAPFALTRLPGGELEHCELGFRARQPVDDALALAQHAAYRAALAELGFEVVALPPLAGRPDAVFVEDVAIALEGVAVLGRPAPASRRDEVAALEPELAARTPLVRIDPPATLEGGDVLAIEDVLYTGQSTRTNHAGLKQLAHLVLEHGYRVKAVGVDRCLHLRTGCTWLGRETLLANPAWVQTARFGAGWHLLEVDPREPFGANAVAVGGRVLFPASAPRTAERVAGAGFDVVLVDLSELEKMEGGPTCLSIRFPSGRFP